LLRIRIYTLILMIEYTITKTKTELQQILDLQTRNLPKALSLEEKKEQGFVTLEHDLDLLTAMHDKCPHVIAKDGDQVVGYALSMLPSFRNDIPLLFSMFEMIDQLTYQDRNLKDRKYFVMGQICIDKEYRGQGVFKKLYHHLRLMMQDNFELVLTLVDVLNTRSSRAHEKVGFQILQRDKDDRGKLLDLILWDWRIKE